VTALVEGTGRRRVLACGGGQAQEKRAEAATSGGICSVRWSRRNRGRDAAHQLSAASCVVLLGGAAGKQKATRNRARRATGGVRSLEEDHADRKERAGWMGPGMSGRMSSLHWRAPSHDPRRPSIWYLGSTGQC
jgi:hypothetical protein